jgi:hypothetical protein
MALILGFHLVLASRVRVTRPFPSSIGWLAVLSVGTATVWIFLATAFAYSFVDCCYQGGSPLVEREIFLNTFALPISGKLYEWFPWTRAFLWGYLPLLLFFLLLYASSLPTLAIPRSGSTPTKLQ